MAARDIRAEPLGRLWYMSRQLGLFVTCLGASHLLHNNFVAHSNSSPTTMTTQVQASSSSASSSFWPFLVCILGIWLVMLSLVIPALPAAGRRTLARIVTLVELLLVGFDVGYLIY